jgi:predicted kinase
VSEDHVTRLAARIAEFHRTASVVILSSEEYCQRYEARVRANRRELLDPRHSLPAALIKRVHTAQLLQLLLCPEQFSERVDSRRIVDGHGDLRPEHICFAPEPIVFDCLEFSAEFRQLDIVDELAFLAMECDAAGADWIGPRMFAAWQAASHDNPRPTLISFYKSFRACVRGKVAALRAAQLSGESQSAALHEALRYLQLAERYLTGLSKPVLIAIGGLMGSGKSTLATRLAELLGAEHLQTDRLRQELFGMPGEQHSYDEGRYKPESRQSVYDEMFLRAGQLLAEGVSVVVDGTFLEIEQRRAIRSLATMANATHLAVHCVCSPAEARRRIVERQNRGDDPSEGRLDLFERQLADWTARVSTAAAINAASENVAAAATDEPEPAFGADDAFGPESALVEIHTERPLDLQVREVLELLVARHFA